MFLTLLSCKNVNRKSDNLIEKDFGLLEKENDSISVEINLSEFNDWKKLLKRTEQIVCNDSLPKIIIKKENTYKNVYLRNPCWEKLTCLLIKEKNILEIHNDKINKIGNIFYPLDSLPKILKRDLENNGTNPELSENPEKLVILISYDYNGIQKLPNTLDKLTSSFEQVTNKNNLKIWLNRKVEVIPLLPPKPTKIE